MVVRISGVCISRANIKFLKVLALLMFRDFFFSSSLKELGAQILFQVLIS